MPRLSKLIEKIEDRLANKWGCWYERNKARVPLYAVLGGIGWYLYGMFLNSLKLGKESVFNTTGEVIESIWVFNLFKNLFAVFTPFGLGVSAFIALMVCLITKKGYSWFSGYKFTRDARGFDILPDGTHGTSGFATKKELAEHLELGSAEEVTGMLLGRIKARPDDPEKYATYVAHRMKPGENNNILCIGAPGSYKSRGFIIPFLMGCAQRSSGGHHESVVVTDPKGELFENLAPYFREHGFYVKAVNFLDMAHSDGWNCLAGLEANPDLVTTVANTIIQNTSGPKEADDFWSRAELNLLMALIHYVCNLKDARGNLLPLEQRSLGDVYKILAYKSVNEINRILAELPPEHPAKGPHGLFLKARENLWGNIIIGLGNRLAVFQNPLVDKITRNHDVDLLLPGQKPCAYFVIISAQDSAYRFLSSLFFSLTFPQLSNYARLHGGRLPVLTNFCLEEYLNIGYMEGMEAAEAKPFGLSAAEKTASQEENDTVEKRAEEAELHEETSEFLEAAEDLHSNLPASAPQGSEADEADWGFEEPVTEEAAAEPAEDECLAADNAETLDASEEKSERTLFYELDFNELDRGLSEEERKEWNSIYASFRGRSAITGTIIGVDLYARYLPRSEARMLENKRELCAVVVPYRIPILIRESEMWELGEERPDFVLRNMVGASIDVIVTKVERTANRAQASRRQASRSQRRFFAAREDLHAVGSRITCRMLAVGPRRCLVDCYGYDLDMTQREIRYAAIPDLRTEFHPGSEIDCIVKEYHPRTGELIVSAKETEVNPFFGAEERHPVGSRRFAMISGKYGGGVFCNLPDGVTCMCNYSYQHEDADFMVGEHVMLMVQRYDQEKLQMYGKIMSKW